MIVQIFVSRDAYLRSLLRNVRSKDPQIGRATAAALSRFRMEPARVGLLYLLHHRDRSVVLAAIEGLRVIGTTEEVEHLMAVGSGWLGDRTLRRAARAAVAVIQDRSAGSPGALSLSPMDAAGSLSLPPTAPRRRAVR